MEMRMNKLINRLNVTSILMAAGVLTGIFLRFFQLGFSPLLDHEAVLAIQSADLAQGKVTEIAGYPLYLILTTIITYLFGPSNFHARLIPALASCFILFAPAMFGRNQKPLVRILLTWVIALEPALIAGSRTAHSDMLTMVLVLSLWSAWKADKKVVFGILLGLFLLSGPGFVLALLFIILTCLIMGWKWNDDALINLRQMLQRKPAWLSALITVLLAGTFFLIIPSGLNAFGKSISSVFSNPLAPTGASSVLILLAAWIHSPLVWIFGIWGGVRSWMDKSRGGTALLIIALVNLILLLVFPGRSPLGLLWSSLPLAYLAAHEISGHFEANREDILPAGGIMLLVAGIILFLIQIFGRLSSGAVDTNIFWLALGGGIVILILTAFLAVLGWSFRIAGFGFTWGLLILLTLNSISAAFQTVQPDTKTFGVFWKNGQVVSDQRLLVTTIEEISRWQRGTPDGLQMAVVGDLPPSLEWDLRNQRFLKVVNGLGPGEQPPLVLTKQVTQPELASAYRGQDFNLNSRISFTTFDTMGWIKWLLVRSATAQNSDTYILWARSDIFPDGVMNPVIEEMEFE